MIAQLLPEFMRPERLWWLLLVAAILAVYIVASRRGVSGNKDRRLRSLLPMESRWKRHFSVAASLLSLASLIIAWAQPLAFVNVERERATVVIAIDVSRSMAAEDVEPDRFTAAKDAAADFVDMLPTGFNLSLVSFAGTASIVVAPTTDRGAVKRAIEALEMAPSTATGEAIYSSLSALALAPEDPDHPDDPAPGAIVLLSDGATNMGRSSSDAAEAAKEQSVPVFTIAYGTANGYVIEDGRRQAVPVDHSELAKIASLSGGKKFSAASAEALVEVYQSIAQSIGYDQITTEVTERYAGIALLFAVIAGAGVVSLAARWP